MFDLKVGENLMLPCQADGFPKPTIQWIFYDKDVKPTPREVK